MKSFIVSLLLAMLLASPAVAAPACKSADRLAHVLDRVHKHAPDSWVKALIDPRTVEVGLKVINDSPPPTHYLATSIVVAVSFARKEALALLVTNGCVTEKVGFTLENFARFIQVITSREMQGRGA